MYLSGYVRDQRLGDVASDQAAEIARLTALPWTTVFANGAVVPVDTGNRYGTSQGFMPDPNEALAAAFPAAESLLRANGYTGSFGNPQGGLVEVIPGEGQDIVRPHWGPDPGMLAWLREKGYTLKKAHPNTGQKAGADYASLWKDGKMVGVNSVNWSNKPGVIGYLVMGTLAAIAGGAALTAAGAIGGGGATAATGAGGATSGAAGTAAKAAGSSLVSAATSSAPAAAAVAAPAAAVAAPAAAAIAPSAGLLATVAKAAPAVLSTVAQVQKITSSPSSQTRSVAPPAGMVEQMMPTPTRAGGSALSPVYDSSIFQQQGMPAWLIPAAIGGGALLLLMMNKRRR